MTDLLHMHDNYIREFDAEVVALGDKYVVLDRTAFYPEGGGQVGDHGTIEHNKNILRVVDTRKQEGMVYHIVDSPPQLNVGDIVHGSLDWQWRYASMRFHTAQHVLSRYLQLNYGLETVGNQVRPGESRADFYPIDDITDRLRSDIETGVNSILSSNLPVVIQFMSRSDAVAFLRERGYQVRYLEMVPKEVTEFRVVTIGDWDASSCAGTHVKNTSEIGTLKVIQTKNVGAKKQRIYFTLST